MKKFLAAIAVATALLVWSGSARAQQTAPVPAPAPAPATPTIASFVPSYFTAAGVTYDYYGGSGIAAETVLGARITGASSAVCPIYSLTTLDLTAKTASIRQGLACLFKQAGNFSLMGLGDAGLMSGTGVTLGEFSGGTALAYDVGAKVTKGKSHFFISTFVRVQNVTGQTVQPVYGILFGPAFE